MKALRILAVIALALAMVYGVFSLGALYGKSQCELKRSTDTNKGLVKQKAVAQKTVNRAATTGAKQEQQRVALDEFFNRLEKEQAHAPADPVDSCVLPPDRLRRWADANAGRADQGAASSEPDRAAQAPANAGLRPGAGLGIKPPRDGARLSPTGGPALQPAGVSGGQP
jgi:hypothetical protein